MHTPVDVTERALQEVVEARADCLITVGGGSTTGLGKALALRTGLPQIVVPTTYAGSEVTSLLGQTEDGVKTTLRDPAILPSTVIYDVDLTLTLPVTDRKSFVLGKRVSVRVDLGGRRSIKKKKNKIIHLI